VTRLTLMSERPSQGRLSLITVNIPDSRDVRKFPNSYFPECENPRVYRGWNTLRINPLP